MAQFKLKEYQKFFLFLEKSQKISTLTWKLVFMVKGAEILTAVAVLGINVPP